MYFGLNIQKYVLYIIIYHIYCIIIVHINYIEYIISFCSNVFKLIFYKNWIIPQVLFHCVFSLFLSFYFQLLLLLSPYTCSFPSSSDRANNQKCIFLCIASGLAAREGFPCFLSLESGNPAQSLAHGNELTCWTIMRIKDGQALCST